MYMHSNVLPWKMENAQPTTEHELVEHVGFGTTSRWGRLLLPVIPPLSATIEEGFCV